MSDKVENPLSNYSYINKDFNAIWAELLETVGKLSAKWDPNASNESDPGVVLIKLIALLADKCNYNIDSNILELFPGTVAQSANARQIFDQLGYSMKWYRAGVGELRLRYKVPEEASEEELANFPTYISIPKFTMFCDADNHTVYTSPSTDTLLSTDGSLEEIKIEIKQGIISDYEILGEKRVTAEQLDNHFRLYFNEVNVAENGIYITNAESENFTEWKKVDNLNVQPLLSKVYKFGVTRENVCYIEFPSDIANIIPDGLFIKYLLTDGLSGNVAKNVVEKFYNNPTIEITYNNGEIGELSLSTDNILISQPVAIVDGKDPETINEAYNNYSKTVGVFNTLVSLRDYTNAIYLFGQEKELISNDIVTDRTNDVQSSYKIVTKNGDIEYTKVQTVLKGDAGYLSTGTSAGSALLRNPYDQDNTESPSINPYGGISELAVIESESEFGEETPYIGVAQNANETTDPQDLGSIDYGHVELSLRDIALDDYEITPFNLKLYLLKYNATPSSSLENYNKTFEMVDFNEGDDEIEERIDTKVINQILTEIDSYKSIQHEFTPLLNNRPTIFINKYPVQALIVPQYKLTVLQAAEIKANIYQALFKQFNSQQIDFGEEITYDVVYDTISKADERIKSVVLRPLEFKTYVVYFNPNKEGTDGYGGWEQKEFNINTTIGEDSINWGIDCFAKSVLAGVTDLYIRDTKFNYALNQLKAESNIAIDVAKVNTEVDITVPDSEDGYVVRPNENIYIQCPNYEDATTYSTSVKFEYYFENGGALQPDAIKADTDYCIKGENSYLIVYWKENDSDSFYKYKVYKKDTVIKPVGFNMDLGICHTIATKAQREENPSLVPLIGTKWRTTTTGKLGVGVGVAYNILSDYWGKSSADDPGYSSSKGVLGSTTNLIIRRLKKVQTQQSDNNYFYWLLNKKTTDENGNSVFKLFEASDTDTYQSYQLQTNEYFLVCNNDLTGMYIFGSGTKIEREVVAGSGHTLDTDWSVIATDISDLNNIGVDVLEKVWVSIPRDYYKISVTEMQFIALGEGAIIRTDKVNGYNISNTPIPLIKGDGDIEYKSNKNDADFTRISQMDLDDSVLAYPALQGWSIFSRLNIDMSTDVPQTLYKNQNITCISNDGTEYRFIGGDNTNIYMQSSEPIATEGGEQIDVSIYNPYTDVTSYATIYGYASENNTQTVNSSVIYNDFTAKLLYRYGTDSITQVTNLPAGKYIIPIEIVSPKMYNVDIKLEGTESANAKITLLNKLGPNSQVSDKEIKLFKPSAGSSFYISLETPGTDIYNFTISFTRYEDESDPTPVEDKSTKIIQIQKLLKYTEREYLDEYGESRYEGESFFNDVRARMVELDYNGIYNYAHEISDEDYIADPLDPQSFFKSNHIYNPFMICQITVSDDALLTGTDIVITKNIK